MILHEDKIRNKFSEVLGVDISVQKNIAKYSYARFAVCKYMRENWGLSLNQIRQLMGYVSHANVLYGIKRLEDLIGTGDELCKYYWGLLQAVPAEELIPTTDFVGLEQDYHCTVCDLPMGVCSCYKGRAYAIFYHKENKTGEIG